MKFVGQSIQCSALDGNLVELQFNLKEDSVNKFNAQTLKELRQAVDAIKSDSTVKGVLLTSGKDCFIVGADVTEFQSHFEKTDAELSAWLKQTNDLFSEIEDFNFPTVSAINGFALGGGFELVLATSYRVMAAETKVGLPETKLGIFPGWGGTVRLSRLIGADNAIEWIASGEQYGAEAALKVGAVDAVVPSSQTRDAALKLLQSAVSGKLGNPRGGQPKNGEHSSGQDWQTRRNEKISPLKLNQVEATMVFEGAKAFVAAKAGPHYPAPLTAIDVMQRGAGKTRNEAIAIEGVGFVKMAKTQVAQSLVGLFLSDQFLKKESKAYSKVAKPVELSAVLGAGIMGGGIAYQSASRGVPILMKDIQPASIQLGLGEAIKLLDKMVSRGKMTPAKMGQVMASIRPTLSYGDLPGADFVIEAVVENEKVKTAVLAEVESLAKEGTILASNTSTISITRLAEGLKHPENFCGMHFFNPVHKMPLVEVIRGKKSSEKAIATAVAYAVKMGKTPIVVNDCAGFLVNRVLFPYFAGFMKLLEDGVDYQKVDQVMEKFGWPMGPAYLLDVVGIDTAHHADRVMAAEFPDRMSSKSKTALAVLFEAKRFGQKNGKGFYSYTPDKKGAPKKELDPGIYDILKPIQKAQAAQISDDEIIARMMLPMIIECSRCLEENIVNTPAEVDMGLIYGLGFPPFRGGALRYTDTLGLAEVCKLASQYTALGKLYEPTEQMQKLAQKNQKFYQ